MSKPNDILTGIFAPEDGELSPEVANYVFGMRFTEKQVADYEVLAEKAQDGHLTADEREELDAMVTANGILMILKAKARHSLIEHPSAA